jgi:hypothetical protein
MYIMEGRERYHLVTAHDEHEVGRVLEAFDE